MPSTPLILQFLKKTGKLAAALLVLSTSLASCTSENDHAPNIVFIFVDDLGYADVGFNGSTYYETPVLDDLAKESLVFDFAYMYPTCSPSRAALFTGKQSFRTGVYTVPVLEKGTDQESIFSRWTVESKHTFYTELLAEAGYKSIHLGKWHMVGPYPEEELGKSLPLKEKLTQPDPWDFSWVEKHRTPEIMKYYPEGRGFLENVAGTYRGDPALEIDGYKNERGGYISPFSNPFIETKEDGEWLTDRLTDDAIAFMEEHNKGPFYVNLHYYAVHRPIVRRSDELFQKYLDKPGDSITGQGLGRRREQMAEYATMIESVDWNVGRVFQYLDEKGLRENTLVVFTSDNGHNVGSNHLLRDKKGFIYEGGTRVPAFLNWPGKINPRRSDAPVMVLDYFPTFLEMAGIDNYEGIMDGNSLVPLFSRDTELFEERPLFWHIASINRHGTCSVIRKNHYKLIQYLADGSLELYDLEKDPGETHNLTTERPDLTKALLNELVEWRKDNNVPLPPNAIMDY